MMKMKTHKMLPDIINKKYKTEEWLTNIIRDANTNCHKQTKLEKQLEKYGMELFFYNLHQFLEPSMIGHYRKNAVLQNGIYILIDGKAALVWNRHKSDHSQKEHFLNLAKTGVYSQLTLNPYRNMNQTFSQGFNMLISQPFSVIQSEYLNVLIMEESVLLKIPDDCLEKTNFYQLYNARIQACKMAKLQLQSLNTPQPLISMNKKIHHFFQLKKLYFHNKFRLKNYGILQEGTIFLKNKRSRKLEGFKSTLLFPDIDYEVGSSQIKIIQFGENPTLLFNNTNSIKLFLAGLKIQRTESKSGFRQLSLTNQQNQKQPLKINQNYLNSLREIQKLNQSEMKKRKKHVASLSKDYQNYIIVSSQFCKERINIAKTYYKEAATKKQYGALFKSNHKKTNTSFNNSIKSSPRNNKLVDLSIMKRYQNISKDLYTKFMFHCKVSDHNSHHNFGYQGNENKEYFY